MLDKHNVTILNEVRLAKKAQGGEFYAIQCLMMCLMRL
jgi:hypothetical protein